MHNYGFNPNSITQIETNARRQRLSLDTHTHSFKLYNMIIVREKALYNDLQRHVQSRTHYLYLKQL